MDLTNVGESALVGWRRKVADKAAPRVAWRTPAGEEQVRIAIGVLFFLLSVKYVVGTVVKMKNGEGYPPPHLERRSFQRS